MTIQIIAAVIATVGFSVLFGVPSKYYPIAVSSAEQGGLST